MRVAVRSQARVTPCDNNNDDERGRRGVRIGIDGWVLGNQVGGYETYVRNVIRALAAVDSDGDYTLFLTPPLPENAIVGAGRRRQVLVRSHNPYVRQYIAFPLALAHA